jgi:hypothetical protein
MTGWADVSARPVPAEVLAEVFGDEAVVVQLRTGAYYAFDAATTARWTALTEAATLGDLADDAELPGLLRYLVGQELIEVRGDLPAPEEGAGAGADSWPGIEKFTDMADLLVLDPIHDIDLDGDGWPTVTDAAG